MNVVRQRKIRKLIKTHDIASVAELVERLKDEGVEATEEAVAKDQRWCYQICFPTICCR
jgi:arginine repressor